MKRVKNSKWNCLTFFFVSCSCNHRVEMSAFTVGLRPLTCKGHCHLVFLEKGLKLRTAGEKHCCEHVSGWKPIPHRQAKSLNMHRKSGNGIEEGSEAKHALDQAHTKALTCQTQWGEKTLVSLPRKKRQKKQQQQQHNSALYSVAFKGLQACLPQLESKSERKMNMRKSLV